jgi:branched-chain amino acid transport system permease protein
MLIQQLVGGLTSGSMYALVAVGCALIFSGMKVVNWAQGEFYMIGAFVALTFFVGRGLPFIISLVLTVVIMFIVGAALEKLTISYVRESDDLTLLMITIGLSIALKQMANIIWSPIGAVFPTIFGDQAFEIGGVYLVPQNLAVLGIGIIMMIIVYLLMYKTKLGSTMRAVSQSRDTSALMGINTRVIDLAVFGLGAALAAIAGVFMAPLTYVEPAMSSSVGIKGFVGAVVGGFGNLYGAVLGGLLIGIVEGLGSLVISSGYKDAIVFAILIIVMIFKPEGLFAFVKGRQKGKQDKQKGGDTE